MSSCFFNTKYLFFVKLKYFKLFDWILFTFVIVNYLLVNLLYISYWQTVEYESSYRYIVVCLHIIIISISFNFLKLKKGLASNK